jgi:cob(I)alamin adenosyltransferase
MGSGDDGTTDLLGAGRVPKHHPLVEAYGTLDEASAALGMARALTSAEQCAQVILAVQRDLYRAMTELAATGSAKTHFEPFEGGRVAWLEQQIERFGEQVETPGEFVLGGDCPAGAAFDVARTVVRRAERLVAQLFHQGEIENNQILRYLNRLSSLCFMLALWENKQSGVEGPILAKPRS